MAGADAIIALRCCKLSGRFEDFWERRAERSRPGHLAPGRPQLSETARGPLRPGPHFPDVCPVETESLHYVQALQAA